MIKHEAEEQGYIAAELNDFPDTALWLRKMDLERYEQVFTAHHVTCDYLLRLEDAQLPTVLKVYCCLPKSRPHFPSSTSFIRPHMCAHALSIVVLRVPFLWRG